MKWVLHRLQQEILWLGTVQFLGGKSRSLRYCLNYRWMILGPRLKSTAGHKCNLANLFNPLSFPFLFLVLTCERTFISQSHALPKYSHLSLTLWWQHWMVDWALLMLPCHHLLLSSARVEVFYKALPSKISLASCTKYKAINILNPQRKIHTIPSSCTQSNLLTVASFCGASDTYSLFLMYLVHKDQDASFNLLLCWSTSWEHTANFLHCSGMLQPQHQWIILMLEPWLIRKNGRRKGLAPLRSTQIKNTRQDCMAPLHQSGGLCAGPLYGGLNPLDSSDPFDPLDINFRNPII